MRREEVAFQHCYDEICRCSLFLSMNYKCTSSGEMRKRKTHTDAQKRLKSGIFNELNKTCVRCKLQDQILWKSKPNLQTSEKIVLLREPKMHTPAAQQLLLLMSYHRGYPIPGRGGYTIPGQGHPLERDLGPVTGVPLGKDMGPVEVLWDGDGVPPERTWNQCIGGSKGGARDARPSRSKFLHCHAVFRKH